MVEPMSAARLADDTDVRAMTDAQFLRSCRTETFRGPGPGGQKRNKTSSAVRIVHEPTGLSAIATESRSQAENRAKALRRLRHVLAIEVRRAVDVEGFASPGWFALLVEQDVGLRIPRRAEMYLPALALVLDVLAACGWSVSAAAALLRLSTGNLAGFLSRDSKALAKVNQQRAQHGLRPLRP